MFDLNEKLEKSLEEIEALADEVLAKSEEAANVNQEGVEDQGASKEAAETVEAEESADGKKVEKGLKPDEVSDDTEEDSEDKDDKDEEDEDEDKDDKDVKKSFVEMAEENEEIAKSIEVSGFLNEFTRLQGAIIDALREDVNKSLETSTHTSMVLAKSFNAIMKSQNALAKSIQELTERIEAVERQPVGRKAVVNVVEKSFSHSAGVTGSDKELTKSQKLSKLTDLALKGTEGVTIQDVIQYESTGILRPELEDILQSK